MNRLLASFTEAQMRRTRARNKASIRTQHPRSYKTLHECVHSAFFFSANAFIPIF